MDETAGDAPGEQLGKRSGRMLGTAALGAVVIGIGVMLPLSSGPDRHEEAQAAIAPPPHLAPHRPLQRGLASWYGDREEGRLTASGTAFDPNALTAAHRTLPLGTRVRVTRVGTPRATIVTITDRGPYVHGRVIDLSPAAANELAMKKKGLVPVHIEVVSTPAAGGPQAGPAGAKKAAKKMRKAAPAPPTEEIAAGTSPPDPASPQQPRP